MVWINSRKGFSAGFSGAVMMTTSCPTRDYKRIVDTLERKRRLIRNSLNTIWSLHKQQYCDYRVGEWWREAGALRFEFWWGFGASGSSSHGEHHQARRYDNYFWLKNSKHALFLSTWETDLEYGLMIKFQVLSIGGLCLLSGNLFKGAHCTISFFVTIKLRSNKAWWEQLRVLVGGCK